MTSSNKNTPYAPLIHRRADRVDPFSQYLNRSSPPKPIAAHGGLIQQNSLKSGLALPGGGNTDTGVAPPIANLPQEAAAGMGQEGGDRDSLFDGSPSPPSGSPAVPHEPASGAPSGSPAVPHEPASGAPTTTAAEVSQPQENPYAPYPWDFFLEDQNYGDLANLSSYHAHGGLPFTDLQTTNPLSQKGNSANDSSTAPESTEEWFKGLLGDETPPMAPPHNLTPQHSQKDLPGTSQSTTYGQMSQGNTSTKRPRPDDEAERLQGQFGHRPKQGRIDAGVDAPGSTDPLGSGVATNIGGGWDATNLGSGVAGNSEHGFGGSEAPFDPSQQAIDDILASIPINFSSQSQQSIYQSSSDASLWTAARSATAFGPSPRTNLPLPGSAQPTVSAKSLGKRPAHEFFDNEGYGEEESSARPTKRPNQGYRKAFTNEIVPQPGVQATAPQQLGHLQAPTTPQRPTRNAFPQPQPNLHHPATRHHDNGLPVPANAPVIPPHEVHSASRLGTFVRKGGKTSTREIEQESGCHMRVHPQIRANWGTPLDSSNADAASLALQTTKQTSGGLEGGEDASISRPPAGAATKPPHPPNRTVWRKEKIGSTTTEVTTPSGQTTLPRPPDMIPWPKEKIASRATEVTTTSGNSTRGAEGPSSSSASSAQPSIVPYLKPPPTTGIPFILQPVNSISRTWNWNTIDTAKKIKLALRNNFTVAHCNWSTITDGSGYVPCTMPRHTTTQGASAKHCNEEHLPTGTHARLVQGSVPKSTEAQDKKIAESNARSPRGPAVPAVCLVPRCGFETCFLKEWTDHVANDVDNHHLDNLGCSNLKIVCRGNPRCRMEWTGKDFMGFTHHKGCKPEGFMIQPVLTGFEAGVDDVGGVSFS